MAEGRSLGTSVRIAVTEASRLDLAVEAVTAVLSEVDQACSRFREDSEISHLHRRAGQETQVSPLLARALRAALRGARLTAGAVDPTVGRAVKAAGYAEDFARVAREGDAIDLTPVPAPGWERIHLDDERGLAFLPVGVEIDLGSTAKAMASDLAAAGALAAIEIGGVLVSLGGDIAVAGIAPAEGWMILTAEDSEAPVDSEGDRIAIRSGGLATSSTTVRRWTRGGADLHHIIDPRTGLPATGRWRTVTVAAGDCLDANIAATAAIVLGESGLSWLAELGLPSRLVDRGGAVVRIAGWPEPASRAPA